MVGEGGRGRTDFALHAGFTRHAGQRIEVHPDAKPRTSWETVGENGGESLEYVTVHYESFRWAMEIWRCRLLYHKAYRTQSSRKSIT